MMNFRYRFVEGADRQAKNDLLEEVEVMRMIGSHPNIVRLLGYCIEAGKSVVKLTNEKAMNS